MKRKNVFKYFSFIMLTGLFVFFITCGTKQEEVNIEELLPEGAVKEITHAHPDFKVFLVNKEKANVQVKFSEKWLHVKGIEKDKTRERIAKYVVQYLENPNKKAEDKSKREAYERFPAKEKLAAFIKRIKEHYPEFSYEWVGLGEGNVKAEYGDNSLLIKGVEKAGGREEIAYGIIQIQKEIDAINEGEEAGTRFAINEKCDIVRNGIRLVLAYDSTSSSFTGTVENVTKETIKSVRVEVHLSNGTELDPTERVNLASGNKETVKLSAEGHSFKWWKAHAEAGDGEHEHGPEGEHIKVK